MRFQVTILGCNAASPAFGRNPSSQVLNVHDQLYMLDCGEGTQMRMIDFKVNRSRLNHIFISHMHGDHVFGLIGLLTSLSLQNRKDVLHLFGPKELRVFVQTQVKLTNSYLSYPIEYHAVNPRIHTLIHEDEAVRVYSLPLKHVVPCAGFLFVENRNKPNLKKGVVEEYAIPYADIPRIKAGGDFVRPDGTVVPFEELTTPAPQPRSYAYCSDTALYQPLIKRLKGVTTIYHEATYLHEIVEKAAQYGHSTARQAAEVAAKAQVQQLLIGHYSAKYVDTTPLLNEALTYFSNTKAVKEGETYLI